MIQVYPTHNRISSAELKENKREQDPIGEVASRPSPYLKLTPPPTFSSSVQAYHPYKLVHFTSLWNPAANSFCPRYNVISLLATGQPLVTQLYRLC